MCVLTRALPRPSASRKVPAAGVMKARKAAKQHQLGDRPARHHARFSAGAPCSTTPATASPLCCSIRAMQTPLTRAPCLAARSLAPRRPPTVTQVHQTALYRPLRRSRAGLRGRCPATVQLLRDARAVEHRRHRSRRSRLAGQEDEVLSAQAPPRARSQRYYRADWRERRERGWKHCHKCQQQRPICYRFYFCVTQIYVTPNCGTVHYMYNFSSLEPKANLNHRAETNFLLSLLRFLPVS